MLSILANRTFRHLFVAQVAALIGTGLLTIALALLAYDLAGGNAGLVLGTVFTIKMVVYVGLSPFAGALAERLPRRGMLVILDLARALPALALPFVTEVWQIYLLVALLQSASAAFTPTFQATIPDILPEEDDYTRALSLSRLAYDLENLASPMLAALFIATLGYHVLFFGTLAGFLISAGLIVTVALPAPGTVAEPFRSRAFRGIVIYLATPRLRGLLALNFAAAAAGAMVIVNTVILVRDRLGLPESGVALAMGAFGLGSMAAALALPRMLDHRPDRGVMMAGAAAMAAALAGLGAVTLLAGLGAVALIVAWAVAGAGYAAILTPAGRLLRRSARPEDRPAIFAAQFALSHACWLVTYPLSGWLITAGGTAPALLVLAGLAAAGLALAARLWPAGDDGPIPHRHDDLPPDHPHLSGDGTHTHEIRIDDLHRHWPEPYGNAGRA